jgi:tRNA-binding protein
MQETSSLPDTEPQIPVDDFFRVDVRAGRVVAAEPFPEARKPSYKLWIDFGDLGTKQSSAQITARYAPEQLIDRLVVAVTNLPPRRVAGFVSEVLVLGVLVPGTDEVVLLAPDADVPVGARVS